MTKANCLRAIVLLIGLSAAFAASAQVRRPAPENVTQYEDLRRPSPEITKRSAEQRSETYRQRKQVPATNGLSKYAAEKIRVTGEDKEEYKSYLENDLKLLKIFAAPACAANRWVIDARDEKCARFPDLLRVSYYSFLRQEHGERNMDFRLLRDEMIAGNGGFLHGLLVDLGEIEIGKIDRQTAEVRQLTEFPIARTRPDELAQRIALQTEIAYRDLRISSRRKLLPNRVYLMRLVSYGLAEVSGIYNKDAVYVFKVGEIENDDTALLLWKRLDAKSAPNL